MGLLLPPPFRPIIFCFSLCQPRKCKSLEKGSHYSFCKNDAHSSFSPESAKALKRLLTTRFAKMMLTPCLALKVHEPYISHEIADSHFTRASFVTEALFSQNDVAWTNITVTIG